MSKSAPSQGKGSKRRPGDEEAYRSNWDDVFGKKPKVRCVYCREPISPSEFTNSQAAYLGETPFHYRCGRVIPLDTSPTSGQAGSL